MLKNLFLLVMLSWVSFTYAKPFVAGESIKEAQSFRVEKHTKEPQAKRSLAGSKIKKNKNNDQGQDTSVEESSSEVRYWEYSEED
ncbi:MAG TPA: hypothetical protein VNJ01_16285 [Bacteriovoracaceae bacterium]|nr:hypothetical protein [Bacteriovoracaceae bacterium]